MMLFDIVFEVLLLCQAVPSPTCSTHGAVKDCSTLEATVVTPVLE
jgi:hypothetical protein